MKRIEASADSASPFFVYLAYQSVHAPHQAPQDYIDMYPNLKQNAIMAAMLSALDDGVANVTAALNRTNQTANTVIILSTDNGGTAGSSNYPLRGEKHSVYEGGVIGTAFITGWGTQRVFDPILHASARPPLFRVKHEQPYCSCNFFSCSQSFVCTLSFFLSVPFFFGGGGC